MPPVLNPDPDPDFDPHVSDTSEPVRSAHMGRLRSSKDSGLYFKCAGCGENFNSAWAGADLKNSRCRNCSREMADKYEYIPQTPPRKRLKRRADLEVGEVNLIQPHEDLNPEDDHHYTPTYTTERFRQGSANSNASSLIVVASKTTGVDDHTLKSETGSSIDLPSKAEDMHVPGGIHDAQGTEMDIDSPFIELVAEDDVSLHKTDHAKHTPAQKPRQLREEARQRVELMMGAGFLASLKHVENAGYDLWKKIRQLVLLPAASKLHTDILIKALVKAEHQQILGRNPDISKPHTARLTVTAVEKVIDWLKSGDSSFANWQVDEAAVVANGWALDTVGFIVDPGSVYDKNAAGDLDRIPGRSQAPLSAAASMSATQQRHENSSPTMPMQNPVGPPDVSNTNTAATLAPPNVLGASALTVSAALQEMYRFNQATIVAHQAQANLAAKTSALFKAVMDETGRAAELSNEVTALKQRNKDLEDDLAQARKEVKSLKERFGEVAKVMGFGVGTAESEDDA